MVDSGTVYSTTADALKRTSVPSNSTASRHYDAAIIGAGPVGSLYALAYARKGARVALFEQNPTEHQAGLKGEWLHPPAARMLEQIGVRLDTDAHATNGFIVFPEDGSEPIPLTYPDGLHGLVCPHETLVLRLREAAENEPNVDLIQARADPLEDGRVTYSRDGAREYVATDRIVGADGRSSAVLRLLGLTTKPTVCSRMIGIRVNGVKLPVDDYGHIFCGGPGPIFMYRLGDDSVCAIMDIPREYSGRHADSLLLNSYIPWLPPEIRELFVEAVRKRRFKRAGNMIRPRVSYGNSRFTVIGDAAGHYHPMTAVGLTLGFGDAMALAESENFSDFAARRLHEIRAPEMLAMGFYEVFADHRPEAAAIRHAIYQIWRRGGGTTDRSMRLLACEDTSEAGLGFIGGITVVLAVARAIPMSISPRAWRRAGGIVRRLALRIGWFITAVHQLRGSRARGEVQNERFHSSLERAFLTSTPLPDRLSQPHDQEHASAP